jgi:hypothetical protein
LVTDFEIGITEKEAAEAYTVEDIDNRVWNKVGAMDFGFAGATSIARFAGLRSWGT